VAIVGAGCQSDCIPVEEDATAGDASQVRQGVCCVDGLGGQSTGVFCHASRRGARAIAGVYVPGQILTATNDKLAVWLMEAVLHTIPNNTSPLQAVIDAPSLFPLTLERPPTGVLAVSRRMEIIRHGLDDDLVMLRTPDAGKSCTRGALR
jgi:hypothetical protein